MLEGKKILVVDDDQPSTCSLDALHVFGVLITSVNNAEDALQCLQDEDFDVLVTEVRLPQMNGYDFCKTLARSPRLATLPVIAASCNPFINSLNIARCPNVVDFLPKPFTVEQIINSLKRVLSGNPHLFESSLPKRFLS